MLLAQTIAIDTIFLIVIVAVKTTTDIKDIQIIMPLVVMDIIMVAIITMEIITDIVVIIITMHLGAIDMGLIIDTEMATITDVLPLEVACYAECCLDINLQNKKSLLQNRRDFLFFRI